MIGNIFERCFPCLKLTFFYFHFAEVDLGNDWLFVICFISECPCFILHVKRQLCKQSYASLWLAYILMHCV